MNKLSERNLDVSFRNLENLLRNYNLNTNDKTFQNNIVSVLKSALAFSKGEYLKNEYIKPSQAFQLLTQSSKDFSFDEEALRQLLEETKAESHSEILDDLVNKLIRVLINNDIKKRLEQL